MMKIIITLIAVFLNSCVFEELQSGIHNNEQKAITLSKQAIEQATNLLNKGNIEGAVLYEDSAKKLIEHIEPNANNSSQLLQAWTQQITITTTIGDWHQARYALQKATQCYEHANDTCRAQYLLQRIITHYALEEYALAAECARRTEEIATQNKWQQILSNAYVYHALTELRLNNQQSAQKYYALAQSIIQEGRVQPANGYFLLQGEIYVINGQLEQGYSCLIDSVKNTKKQLPRNIYYESQKTYFLAMSDFRAIYNIERSKKAYRDTLLYIIPPLENTYKTTNIYSRNIERAAFILLLLLVCAFSFHYSKLKNKMFNRQLKEEQRRLNEEIAQQAADIQKREQRWLFNECRLAESITLAERIQHSIMPAREDLKIPGQLDSFIILSPLDVVSGDFYWFTRKGDYLIAVCGDCTGHGVTGAMMSVISITILNGICTVAPDNITPAEILERLDEILLDNLAKNQSKEQHSNEGCDAAVLSINLKTREVITAAARRPIIVFKDQEMIELKPTKRSIGDVSKVARERKFENTQMQLHPGDMLYLFSDGYTDQFGGEKGDKLRLSNLLKVLRYLHDDDVDEQYLMLQDYFVRWKGDRPQIDDVIMLGIRIEGDIMDDFDEETF